MHSEPSQLEVPTLSFGIIVFILVRSGIHAERTVARLSVRLSHGWSSQKELKLGL